MRNNRVKLSADQREDFVLWVEDRLYWYKIAQKSEREKELRWERMNEEDIGEDWSEEKREGWERLQQRIQAHENLTGEAKIAWEKEVEECYQRIKKEAEESRQEDRAMFALLPKFVKRTIKNKDEFLEGTVRMSKKTVNRLKITCLIHRAILLLGKDE